MTQPDEDPPTFPASGKACRFDDKREAIGWRWLNRVKARPGRWEPVCADHLFRSGVPRAWRWPDCENDRLER